MNVYDYDSIRDFDEVEKTPITTKNDLHFWIIIGSSIGGIIIIITIISVFIYLKRRKSKANKIKDYSDFNNGSCRNGHFDSFSSTGSDDGTASDSNSSRKSPYCSSYNNHTGLPSVISECIQPKDSTPNKWYSTFSPNCQSTTTILGSLAANSIEKELSDDDNASNDNTSANGRLWFSLTYKLEENELTINLIKAKYLPGRGLTNAPRDPFVKIFLLPDEETSFQSKIRKRTLNPKFNEFFSFKVNNDDLARKSIRFSVYDVDKRKIRHNLGHVIFPLNRMETLNGEIMWKDLDPNVQHVSTLGEIQIGLGYNPYTSKIKVNVGAVRNIQGILQDNIGVYVKVQLYHGHKLMKNRKTGPHSISLDSIADQNELLFDETFNFGVSGRFFDSCSFTFTLMLTGIVSTLKDKPHGRIVIGPFMYARGDLLQHWQEMLTNTRTLVTKWHNLEPVASD